MKRLFLGLILTLAGVVLLLDSAGALRIESLVGSLLPIIFIIIGLFILLSGRSRKTSSAKEKS